jgi:hypothetical protein
MHALENPLLDKVEAVKPLQFCAVASLRPKKRWKVSQEPAYQIVSEQLPKPIGAKSARPARLHRSHPPLQIWKSPDVEVRLIPPPKSRLAPLLQELTDLFERACASFSLAHLRHVP